MLTITILAKMVMLMQPVVRDIARHLGFKSSRSGMLVLNSLIGKGLVERGVRERLEMVE